MHADITAYARSRKGGLTLSQRSAIDLLVSGKNDTETAQLLNLARTTVSKWRLYDPVFQAELEVVRHSVWGAGLDGLRVLIPVAIAVVAEGLKNPVSSFRAGIALLRLVRLPVLSPTRPTSAEETINDMVLARLRSKKEVRQLDQYDVPPVFHESVEQQYRIATEEVLAEIQGMLGESEAVTLPPAAGVGNTQEHPATFGHGDGAAPRLDPASQGAPERSMTREHAGEPLVVRREEALAAERPTRPAFDGNVQEPSATGNHASPIPETPLVEPGQAAPAGIVPERPSEKGSDPLGAGCPVRSSLPEALLIPRGQTPFRTGLTDGDLRARLVLEPSGENVRLRTSTPSVFRPGRRLTPAPGSALAQAARKPIGSRHGGRR